MLNTKGPTCITQQEPQSETGPAAQKCYVRVAMLSREGPEAKHVKISSLLGLLDSINLVPFCLMTSHVTSGVIMYCTCRLITYENHIHYIW